MHELCPCGATECFSACCDIYISGKQTAPTAEALMRSRYTAYTKANITYIIQTMFGPALEGFNAEDAYQWATQSEWHGLKVIRTTQENPAKTYVEFIANYSLNGKKNKIHECSEFHFINNHWYYVNGKII